MKRFGAVFLSMFVALGITLGTGCALGGRGIVAEGHGHEGEYEVTLSSRPRFPVVGREAELAFVVSHDGSPKEGLEVMAMLAKVEEGGHMEHGGEEQQEAEAPPGDEAAPGDEAMQMVHLMAVETSPGVYVAKHTFEQGGRYVATVSVLGDEVDVTVAVRSSPVAWWFVIGLAGISALLAGTVAVVKTVRREW